MYQYNLYRSKKDNSGVAVQFKVNKESLYLSLAKQKSSEGKNGTYHWLKKGDVPDNKKSINIKFGLPDIGSFLSVIDGKQDKVDIYHEFVKDDKKSVTHIGFVSYSKEGTDKQGKPITYKGYALNINRDGEKYSLVISVSEAEVLKLVLQEAAMNQCYIELKEK